MKPDQSASELLLFKMLSKGYVEETSEGNFRPSVNPPSENEDEQLVDFWKYLTKVYNRALDNLLRDIKNTPKEDNEN